MNASNSNATVIATMNADADAVLRKNSRSFSIAARFLPSRVRNKIQQLYAWCRAVDDAVDDAETTADARRELDQLAEDLRRIADPDFAGIETLGHPASAWIVPLVRDGSIDVAYAKELIEGMRIDLRIDHGEASIETENELLHYCYHAAGTVGLMMSQIMGVTRPVARSHAKALGIAMQLTNIARDVREDAERGRCYLPGIVRVDDSNKAEIQKAVRRVLALAEDRYRIAEAGLVHLPNDCRRAIRVALAAYREIGREITRRDEEVLSGRIVVPKLRLLSVVTRAALPEVLTVSPNSRTAMTTKISSENHSSVAQCKHAVWLGLSLTAFMATALFVMVYVNPKSDAYSSLPLVYAAASLTFAVVANRLAARQEGELSK